ncbi:MAG TPA: SPOR domain-containing protein [Terriglobales bacterium]|jgi:cell division septation protein DedD|nr:SPOR domain-containing protein [Terriglobales bacterium]
MTPVMAAPARDPRSEYSEDTEITLGTGKMLALFFGLVVLCATFFGMGYSIGHNSAKTNAELLPSPSTSRPTRLSTPATQATTAPLTEPQTVSKPADTQQAAPDSSSTASSTTPPSTTDQVPSLTPQQPVASYFVQVAAVSKQEDAQALVDSLKGRQYQAFIADATPDKLFHVQVGPFTDVKEAESMRARLVNDGYNPILKK